MNSRVSFLIFLLIAVTLELLNGHFISQQGWFGDFWHHAALVNSLKSDLWPSSDPFLPGEAAVLPYWPYEAFTALLARTFALSAIDALSFMSYINLGVLLIAVFLFARRRMPNTAPVLIILILGCWGTSAPNFSAFFHARVFFFVLSYPSTLAFALTLLCASWITSKNASRQSYRIIAAVGVGALIVLIHPITFLLHLALCADSLCNVREMSLGRKIVLMGAIVAVPIIEWTFWPLFPLGGFLSEQYFSADPQGVVVYQNMISTIGPAFTGFIFLLLQLRDRSAPPAIALALQCSIVLFGYLREEWNYGRVIAYIVILLQVIIAAEWSGKGRSWRPRKIAAMLVALIALQHATSEFAAVFAYVGDESQKNSVSRRVLAAALQFPRDGTVLADGDVSKVLPALGVHVTVFDVPPFFRNHYKRLREEQDAFFNANIDRARACKILKQNNVRSIIVDQRSKAAANILSFVEANMIGQTRRIDGDFSEVIVNPATCAALDTD